MIVTQLIPPYPLYMVLLMGSAEDFLGPGPPVFRNKCLILSSSWFLITSPSLNTLLTVSLSRLSLNLLICSLSREFSVVYPRLFSVLSSPMALLTVGNPFTSPADPFSPPPTPQHSDKQRGGGVWKQEKDEGSPPSSSSSLLTSTFFPAPPTHCLDKMMQIVTLLPF